MAATNKKATKKPAKTKGGKAKAKGKTKTKAKKFETGQSGAAIELTGEDLNGKLAGSNPVPATI